MFLTVKIICFVCALVFVMGILLTGCKYKDKVVKVDVQNEMLKVDIQNDVLNVDLKGKVLCAAKSVTASGGPINTLTLDIPPNAGITKIYATIAQKAGTPLDGGSIVMLESSMPTFSVEFSKDPQATKGSYETTLVQPLCVGPEGATMLFDASRDNVLQEARGLVLTVVYCPDYCTD